MTRVLVAGIGNVFCKDDGFGVEVARRLATRPPPETKVGDFGIRAIHLAYELLDPPELCIIADCTTRGGAPGTVYVIEPDADEAIGDLADAHGMNLAAVFAAVRQLGGRMPRTLVVGCEPEHIEPGMGLGCRVSFAIDEAIGVIRELISDHRGDKPGNGPQ
jgi:hydrogenase maturation protease